MEREVVVKVTTTEAHRTHYNIAIYPADSRVSHITPIETERPGENTTVEQLKSTGPVAIRPLHTLPPTSRSLYTLLLLKETHTRTT